MKLLYSYILFLVFPLLRRFYNIKIAQTKEEKIAVFKFRYQIYGQELSHYFLNNKISKNKLLCDEYDFIENTITLYSGDITNITGTIRLSTWKNKYPQKILNKYRISKELLDRVDSIGEIRFLQVKSEFRKGLLGLMLIFSLYKLATDYIQMGNDLTFCDCQPGLIANYLKVGCFAYTQAVISEEYGMLQVPLVIAAFDLDYLKKEKSLTYYIAKHTYKLYQRKFGKIRPIKKINSLNLLPHYQLYFNPKEIEYYRDKIESDKLKHHLDLIIGLFKKIIIIPLTPQTILIKSKIIDYDLYVLLEGQLGVYIGNKLIATLYPGHLVGEMAFLDNQHKRQADVITLTECKILIIPRNFLSYLKRHNPKAANEFLSIISHSLIDKLISINHVLSKMK